MKTTKESLEQIKKYLCAGNPVWDVDKVSAVMDEAIEAVEKQTAKRVLWNGWQGYRDTRYKCPSCKKPVRNTDHFCHRCGQKLIFPQIDFTPYVKGQKQELIVTWEDEDGTD